MIKLINVNKYYQSGSDKIHVIKNLNYEFPDEGLIFILGPSGSGKSTLLNLLGGLDKPDSGEIWIENRKLSSFTRSEQNYYLNSYLGFVFQEYNILKDLNLRSNIKLALEIEGEKAKVSRKKVNEIIKDVELTGLEKRKVSQLSGGQKQRIAIARALVKDPSLIIADEPTGNLDSETSAKIFELFKKLSKNRLIIIVTHDEESAKLYGDDILRIDVADSNEEETPSNNDLTSSSNEKINDSYFEYTPSRKLHLEKAKTPINTILKLSFKNMWQKKFRYLLMLVISTISLVFLAFAIELNGDKLYQNVYTTINNNVNYTDIYQYQPTNNTTNSNDFYAKYEKGPLMNNAYSIIKNISNDVIVHKYQKVSIDYAKFNIKKANFLFTGKIDAVINYDPTNTYNLLSGTLPNPNEPEIIITDYLVDSLKHFGIVSIDTNIYNILNKHLNLGYDIEFKIVGVVESNYKKWSYLSRLPKSYIPDSYDKSMQGFDYDYLMMNSFIVGSTYYDYINNNTFQNTEIYINSSLLVNNKIVRYSDQEVAYGKIPDAYNEIVIPYELISIPSNWSWRVEQYINTYVLNTYITVETKIDEITTESETFDALLKNDYKIVGVTNSHDAILSKDGFDSYTEAVSILKANNYVEKVIIELPRNPQVALQQFKNLYNNDYHFIVDIFHYRDSIDSYNVDPMIDFVSKGGLIVFTILTIGIIWTIISIEIVDSRKEIGIMRSLGLSGFKVSLIFIIQSLFINIIAYLLSIPIANYLISLYGGNILDSLGEISLSLYTLTYRSPVILFVFVVIVTLVSTFIPLIKIMSKRIINVINERDN